MSNLMRLPHEISLWEDVLTVVDSDGNEYEGFVPSNKVTVVAQYYKEKKLCVISSDKIESPIHVVDPVLVRKTDGTSTLTFSIYAKYWDEESGELVDNPFIRYLTNERKVKLKYFPNGKLKWLDLVIKKIDESSENYKFTYTATDLFINELSKSGYNLEFDMELENNQGPINKLASKVLAGTDWVVGADSELLQQTVTEALYAVTLTEGLNAKDIFTEDEKIIQAGETIYVYYSVIANKTYDYFQFIYSEDKNYTEDENGVVYNSGNYYAELDENNLPYDKPVYFNDFRAERYVRSPKVVYDKVIGKYVNVYNNDMVRGYSESEYISPALVNNFITNGAHIISNSGWLQQKVGSVKTEMLPTYKETTLYDQGRLHCIEFEKSDVNTYLLNTGLSDNASKIGSIVEGDTFVFRIKGGAPVTKEIDEKKITTGTSAANISFNVEIAAYTFNDNGSVTKKETLASGTTSAKDEWHYNDDLKFTRAISVEELTDLSTKRFGIFISINGADGTYYIHEVEFFKRVEDQNGYIILPNGQVMRDGKVVIDSDTEKPIAPAAYVDTTYYYYTPNDEATDISEIKYFSIGKRALNTYKPDYVADFEKIRSINAKETNRFNLLQTLSETFECWCRFDVLHKASGEIALARDLAQDIVDANTEGKVQKIYDGEGPMDPEEKQIDANLIKTVEDGYRQQKFVTFHKRIGQKKPIGFTYGINLKSISRSLDSNDIATKLIVKSNNNKYANMGSCNIARANMNPSGENFVLDFSHYIRQNLLNYENVQRDLYLEDDSQGWLGLFPKLKANNIERDKLITEQSSLIKEYSKFKSEDESSKLLLAGAQEELTAQRNYYKDLTGLEYGEIETLLLELERLPGEIETLEKQIEDTPSGEELEALKKQKEKKEARKIWLEGNKENFEGWLENTKVIATATSIEQLKEEIKQHTENSTNAEDQLDFIEGRLDKLEEDLSTLKDDNRAELDKFEQKYSRFLQEASWISEDYTDDNLYYIDAESTLHKSAQPKVSYAINIVELSALEGYEAYNFDLGDITYVQDPDFFGWETKEGAKTPRKEEVVITESATYFNSPEKNTLKAQNYRDSFEDLFQRMTATTQQLQFYGGSYDRAADVVDTNGNIMPKSLSEAFANNAYVLSNIANQSVKWDEYGITTTDTTDPTDIVRITSGGIYLTEDGGRNWTTGISASGINAKTITTGQLDTGAVTIMSGNQTAFRWDDSGINAYKDEDGKRSSQTYVRFDEHGLYGIDGQASFDPDKENENGKTGIEKINEEAKFALTWDGFVLNSSDKTDNTAQVKISDTEDIQIIDKDGTELVKIGRLDGENSAGMRVSVDQANSVVIGDTGLIDTSSGKHGKLVFRAGPIATVDENGDLIDNAPFRVYEDGFFYAKTGQIGGALTEARLRDIRLDASYITKTNGSSVILTCEPTINGDELSNIRWSVNEIEYSNGNNKLSIELTYDELANFRNEENAYGISVKADIGEEELESFTDTMSLLPDNIFKLVTEYVIGNNGTDIPGNDVDWSRDMPTNIAPGSYLWTRFGNVFLDGTATYRYEVTYQGKDGSGQFTSIVFKRTTTNTTPSTPSGGSYSDPIPDGWSDGILADGGPYVWSSQAVFKPDGTDPAWSTPILMRDVSGKFDVQYSNETEQPANPTDAPEKWYDASLTGADLTNAIWMATRSSEDGGASWSVWTITRIKGEDGVAAQDLNLKADSYVFVQDKDGNITPSQINLTATAYNLSGGVITWSGVDQDIDNITNTATLSYNANDYVNGNGHTVSVTYTDVETGQVTFTDSITILLVKDGSDAISASLTNPTMTFAEGAISTETTGAIVYYGSTPINYATSGNTGWRYTITCEGAVSIKNGIVSIDNPGETTTFEAIIVVYKDGNVYRTQTLVINCLVTESPYTIELSNDNATIGIDENGAYDEDSLKLVTQTNVTVHKGITDITGECTFIWSAQGGILSSSSGISNFFTRLLAGQTTAIATVYVKYGDTIIGTKTLKVATVEAGAAVSYKLNVAPNTVNLTSVEEATISLEVLKIVGGSVERLDSGYVIYVNGINKGLITSSDISADTTFELYIGNNKWDSETVSVVHDGNDSTVPGPQGYSGATITLYKRSASTPTGTNAKPSGSLTYTFSTKTLTGSLNNWSTSVPTGSNPCYAIYAYATSNTDTDTIATTEWSAPIAIEAKDGENGINTAVIFLYKRASSKPSGPTGPLTYDFASGSLSAASSGYFNNWKQTMPAADGNPCYFIQNVVAGTGATATIAKTDWSDPQVYVKDGSDGHTIQTVSAYYRSDNFSTPTKPTDYSSTLPSGWSTTPQSLTDTYKYQYISQCTVTDSAYGTWTSPVLFARYGSDGQNGSDATVTALNVFNALTSNGNMYGCFGNDGESLYINANFINTGIFRVGNTGSEIFFADINSQNVEIGGWTASNGALYTTGNSLYLGTTGITASIGGITRENLVFKAGSNFGVDSSGALYAASGSIGNFQIDEVNLSSTFYGQSYKGMAFSTPSVPSGTGLEEYPSGSGEFIDAEYYTTTYLTPYGVYIHTKAVDQGGREIWNRGRSKTWRELVNS